MRNTRSAPAAVAAAAIEAPRGPDVVATDSDAPRSSRAGRRSADPRTAVVVDEVPRQELDIDVDAVETQLIDEVDEDLDPARLGVRLGVEPPFLVSPKLV